MNEDGRMKNTQASCLAIARAFPWQSMIAAPIQRCKVLGFVIARSEATWQSREGTYSLHRLPIKTYNPIASVAALSERLVQGHLTVGEHWCTAALP